MEEETIIDQALTILKSRLRKPEQVFTASKDVTDYLTLQFAELEHESFQVMYLDNQHGLLELKEMFRGTVNSAMVYPREIVKAALAFNAAAVILSHNHPSGDSQPSTADKMLTEEVSQALKLVDVRVLDHIVIGHLDTYSFADNGLL